MVKNASIVLLRENLHVRNKTSKKATEYGKKRHVILEIRILKFGSVRCSVRPYFAAVRFGSAEPQKRQFGRSLSIMF